ncbi:MAG: hypothetical protein Q7V63_03850 [Gammaproteobacteria bacterium]|nr:hypothetical protein [Gammaproteobacteria bacterium]
MTWFFKNSTTLLVPARPEADSAVAAVVPISLASAASTASSESTVSIGSVPTALPRLLGPATPRALAPVIPLPRALAFYGARLIRRDSERDYMNHNRR